MSLSPSTNFLLARFDVALADVPGAAHGDSRSTDGAPPGAMPD